MRTEVAARPYAIVGRDLVRDRFERTFFARVVPRLLGGEGAMLDLGCGDGLAASLAGPRLRRYLGVDLEPPDSAGFVRHDLRDGLGPVGAAGFDLYLGTFGVASHLPPASLSRLVAEIAAHARAGAVVALEALGLRSLEWPPLWEAPPGPARAIPYRLGSDVTVHPWLPQELARIYEAAGIRPLAAIDRTIQAGPKAGDGRYYSGVPDIRGALNALLAGESPPDPLRRRLPPLPAGPAAELHHRLAARRAALAGRGRASLADAIWALEPPTGGGYGHGLLILGRVR
jgi:SAM-dependent methyltransferase